MNEPCTASSGEIILTEDEDSAHDEEECPAAEDDDESANPALEIDDSSLEDETNESAELLAVAGSADESILQAMNADVQTAMKTDAFR